MSVPTHDVTCLSKAYKTYCPDCHNKVWYFSCTCGSKVFFDELGYPWEIHECREYRIKEELKMIQEIDRLSSDEIYRIITKYEKSTGTEIDDEVMQIIEDNIGSRRYDLQITQIVPQKGQEDISGYIMEVNNPINIFKKLGYDASNLISIKLLGDIGKQEWLQIRVRTKPDKRNKCLEYLCYVTKEYFRKHPINQKDFIVGIIDGKIHPKGIIWVLRSHQLY